MTVSYRRDDLGKNVLAIDLGASSGRAIVSSFDGENLELTEVHRFSDYSVFKNDHLCWDFDRIFKEIKQSILKACTLTSIDSMAIDSWGVDFGLINFDGVLLNDPLHYRDKATAGLSNRLNQKFPNLNLYEKTGVLSMDMNSIYQLYYQIQKQENKKRINKILFIPDLINYYLTGEVFVEKTIASTSQLYNPHLKNWDNEIIDTLDFDRNWFPEILLPASKIGKLKSEICDELSIGPIDVIVVGSHDTASAIAAMPNLSDEDNIYISSGTWSLIGVESNEPVFSDFDRIHSLSNEEGIDKINSLVNLTGLWILQECRRYWTAHHYDYSFSELTKFAEEAPSHDVFIDISDDTFAKTGPLPEAVINYLKENFQFSAKREDFGTITRIIYESMALKYAYYVDIYEKSQQKSYDSINILGGGSNINFLNQLTANVTNKTVIAGPDEATAIGNSIVQYMYHNCLNSIEDARKLVYEQFEIKKYLPADQEKWNRKYTKYVEFIR